MEIIILAIVINIGNILCFIIGAKITQKLSKKEEIIIPELNPVKAIKERQLTKQQEEELGKYNTIFENIDNYDGTGANQKEV